MAKLDTKTGELKPEPVINQVITKYTTRKNGTVRIQQDFSNCPTMAEQHTAHLTDINYLISKYRPDDLAAYLAARASYRTEILGHDFSQELSLQQAKNTAYQLKQAFNDLPEEVKNQFDDHVSFLKFIDNPANQEKMIQLGLLSKKQVDEVTAPLSPKPTSDDSPKT